MICRDDGVCVDAKNEKISLFTEHLCVDAKPLANLPCH